MTHGRQTPEQVAAAGLRALEHRRGPTVTFGLGNRLLASGYRVMPRALMLRMARRNVRPT
jgi:short-subunit dehydrogenase